MANITFDHPGVTFDDWRYAFDGNMVAGVFAVLHQASICQVPADRSTVRLETDAPTISINGALSVARFANDNSFVTSS